MNPDNNRQPRTRWPYPADTPLVRARKIAHMYRGIAHAANPDACQEADATARMYGETWAVPHVITAHDEDLLTPADAADYLCTSTANIRRLRLTGQLNGHHTPEGWRYQVADLKTLQQRRPRNTSSNTRQETL